MRIRFTVRDNTHRSLARSTNFIDTMVALINEHTTYTAFAGEGIIRRTDGKNIQFNLEVQDADIDENPDLVPRMQSLSQQIIELGKLANFDVTFGVSVDRVRSS